MTEPTPLTPAPSANADSSLMTVKAIDPDGFPIEYGLTYFDSATNTVFQNKAGSLPPALASPTIIRDSSDGSAEFKFISRTSDSDGSGNATDGELKIRYQATDGIRTGVSVSTIKNAFGYNLWRYFPPSGHHWGTDGYFHMDTTNQNKIGWYSSTSRSASTDILRGNTSLTSTALTYKTSGVASQGTYGWWRGGSGRDFFSDAVHGFNIVNDGDFFKGGGGSNLYLYATTGTSGTNNLVGNRDMLYFWFADPLSSADLVGSVVAFFQLQGWVVWNKPWLQSIWWMYFTSLIIAPMFFWSTKWSYEHFGAFWNMRLAGFGISTIIFGIMAWMLIGEIPTLKTIISLLLALAIILIQVSNL